MIETTSWRDNRRISLRDAVPLATPRAIVVETSASCNARCVYCIHSKERFGGNMSMKIFEKLLSDLHEFPDRIRRLDMYGIGEPLVNPDLEKMIGMAKHEGVAEEIAFITNGILFTRERVDSVIASGVDAIRISLQGLDAEKYEEVCGVKIDFNRFVDTLAYLYKHRHQCKIYMKIADIAIRDESDREKLQEIFGEISDGVYVEHIMPIYGEIDYAAISPSIVHQNRRGGYGRIFAPPVQEYFTGCKYGSTGLSWHRAATRKGRLSTGTSKKTPWRSYGIVGSISRFARRISMENGFTYRSAVTV